MPCAPRWMFTRDRRGIGADSVVERVCVMRDEDVIDAEIAHNLRAQPLSVTTAHPPVCADEQQSTIGPEEGGDAFEETDEGQLRHSW